ncbi:eukaryotic translation initiation factor 3 subunit G [Thraustotheca clavata]|uniref:Eukaryotic translation initiation factor 3 subunit G n=1 Tax=Thraustotheca clavata TaxID=74557 RepID=A0A1W0A897_9STRA|nr:eukaryotic translation initiation factor 3 subunit G [Thraustotheca clavata]
MAGSKQQRWGDEDEDYLPPRTEKEENGIKTIISWKFDEEKNKVKVTTKIKKVQETTRLSKRVLERANWAKFGEALQEEGNNNVTYTPPEAIYMEDPSADQVLPGEEKEKESVFSGVKNSSIVVCRHCGMVGDHWTLKCPYKDSKMPLEDMSDMPRDDEEEAAPSSAPSTEASFPRSTGAPGKYVPPSLRGKAASTASEEPRQQTSDKDSATLRVTNISPETREEDLKELFRVFGPLERVYLAKDRETFQSRGFAFVSYVYREDAEKAMEKLQGYGYDHLILKLEWAKPSNKTPVDEGAVGTTFRSGYGKALPQNIAPPMRK